MNFKKHIYSGNGHDNNIGYYVEKDGYEFFFPSCNNFEFYDEHYNSKLIDEGDHLKNEASLCLPNVYTNNSSSLEEAMDWLIGYQKESIKMVEEYNFKVENEILSDEEKQAILDAQE